MGQARFWALPGEGRGWSRFCYEHKGNVRKTVLGSSKPQLPESVGLVSPRLSMNTSICHSSRKGRDYLCPPLGLLTPENLSLYIKLVTSIRQSKPSSNLTYWIATRLKKGMRKKRELLPLPDSAYYSPAMTGHLRVPPDTSLPGLFCNKEPSWPRRWSPLESGLQSTKEVSLPAAQWLPLTW